MTERRETVVVDKSGDSQSVFGGVMMVIAALLLVFVLWLAFGNSGGEGSGAGEGDNNPVPTTIVPDES